MSWQDPNTPKDPKPTNDLKPDRIPKPNVEIPKVKPSGNLGMTLGVAAVAFLGGLGAFYYFNNMKKVE